MTKIIDYVMFPFDILVCINITDDEFFKEIQAFDIPSEHINLYNKERVNIIDNPRGCVLYNYDTNATIMRLHKIDLNNLESLGVIVHECYHAIEHLLRDSIGIKQCNKTSEIYSYTQQYLFNEIIKLI